MSFLLFAPLAAAAPYPESPPPVWKVALVSKTTVDRGALMPLEAPELPQDESTDEIGEMVLREFPDAPIMFWVALNESGFDPYAESGTGPKGVFQIANQTWKGFGCTGSVYDAADNIQCARKIYDANGLKDWRWSKWEGFDGGWGKRL